jgi:hypothetical protein
VSVSGKLESVIDIRDRNNLGGFVNLIKDFRLSKSVIVKARRFGFPLRLVKTTTELGAVLEQSDWRNWPMVYDVPSTCQVFGSFVMNAGIEGMKESCTAQRSRKDHALRFSLKTS